MNLLSKGIDWFNTKRKENLVESVIVKTAERSIKVDATVLEPETFITPNGLKVKTDKYTFLIEASLLQEMDMRRGAKILRGLEEYEVIIEGGTSQSYNDPNNTTLALAAQLRA